LSSRIGRATYAESFEQLDIQKVSVKVTFDATVILIEDVAARTIGAEDLIF